MFCIKYHELNTSDPNSVTLVGSPPKAIIFCVIHSIPRTWSRNPRLVNASLVSPNASSPRYKKPRAPSLYWIVTTTTSSSEDSLAGSTVELDPWLNPPGCIQIITGCSWSESASGEFILRNKQSSAMSVMLRGDIGLPVGCGQAGGCLRVSFISFHPCIFSGGRNRNFPTGGCA